MSKIASLLSAVLLCTLATTPADAQVLDRLSVEARLGGVLATGAFDDPAGDLDAGAGYALGASARWDFTSIIAGYIGYQYVSLACAGCEEVGLDGRVADAGIQAGIVVRTPSDVVRLSRGLRRRIPGASLSPWLRAGIVRQRLSFFADAGRRSSEPGLGFELGAGIDIDLAGGLVLKPGIQYRSYTATFELGTLPAGEVDVSHMGVELGLVYGF